MTLKTKTGDKVNDLFIWKFQHIMRILIVVMLVALSRADLVEMFLDATAVNLEGGPTAVLLAYNNTFSSPVNAAVAWWDMFLTEPFQMFGRAKYQDWEDHARAKPAFLNWLRMSTAMYLGKPNMESMDLSTDYTPEGNLAALSQIAINRSGVERHDMRLFAYPTKFMMGISRDSVSIWRGSKNVRIHTADYFASDVPFICLGNDDFWVTQIRETDDVVPELRGIKSLWDVMEQVYGYVP